MATKLCPYCRTPLAIDARFCSRCGKAIPKDKPSNSSGNNSKFTLLVVAVLAISLISNVRFLFGGTHKDAGTNSNASTPPTSAFSTGTSKEDSKGDWREQSLMADTGDSGESAVLGSAWKRNEIRSVSFLDSLSEQGGNAWDVSAEQDGSVMAWIVENGGLYDLYIGADGGMAAPEDCSGLFMGYENAGTINFNGAFHTGSTTSMSNMFSNCEDLEQVDVSCLDTSQVTNMTGMFNFCGALETLDVSGFDTARVTDMSAMFNYCESLDALDVSGFDTSNVTSMSGMFSGCKSLTALDVSNFDISSTEYMSYMFCECEKLSKLNVDGWDISDVGYTVSMLDATPLSTSIFGSSTPGGASSSAGQKVPSVTLGGPTLPDLQAFSGNKGVLTEEVNMGSTTQQTYYFKLNDIFYQEYLDLLTDSYNFRLRDTHDVKSIIILYTYDYVGSGDVTTFDYDHYGYDMLDGREIDLLIKVYRQDGDVKVILQYGAGITCVDTGERTSQNLTPYGDSNSGSSSSQKDPEPNGNNSGSSRQCSRCWGEGKIECPDCGGKGTETCGYCNGTGGRYETEHSTLYDGAGSGSGTYKVWKDCSRCWGSKKEDCGTCYGRKTVDCPSC